MARPSYQVTAAAAAGAGLLLLLGCGSAAAPGAARSASAPASSPAKLASHFCAEASDFMRNIPEEPNSKHLTATQAQANMNAVLVSTLKGFAALEKESPASLSKPLRKIIAVYKADEKILRKTGDMSKVSESMIQGDGSGSAAFQAVLEYITDNCH